MSDRVHPAIELIVEAETRPVFAHHSERALALLQRAAATNLTGLAPRWRARRALRLAYILMQRKEYTEAQRALDLGAAAINEHGLSPLLRARHHILCGRLANRTATDFEPIPILDELAEGYVSKLTGVTDDDRLGLETRANLALAEYAVTQGHYAPIRPLLEDRIRTEAAFGSVDDLWQTLHLVALAYLVRLQPERALTLLASIAEMCALHEADVDRADALAALANAKILCGDTAGGAADLEAAAEVAAGAGDSRTEWLRRTMLTTSLTAAGDLEGAIAAAERSAVITAEQDDYVGYVTAVGLVTGLTVHAGQHKRAYQNLLHIASNLNDRFGPDAAQPIVDMINRIKEIVGTGRFEEIAAELLAEIKEGSQ